MQGVQSGVVSHWFQCGLDKYIHGKTLFGPIRLDIIPRSYRTQKASLFLRQLHRSRLILRTWIRSNQRKHIGVNDANKSWGNRITRKIYVEGTANPLTGAVVYAHPVNVTGTTQDILLTETPANSGFYLSSGEVKHGTYVFKVNGVTSDDEITVEPGRVCCRHWIV